MLDVTASSIEVFDTVIRVDIMVFGAIMKCQFFKGWLWMHGRMIRIAIMQLMLSAAPPNSHSHQPRAAFLSLYIQPLFCVLPSVDDSWSPIINVSSDGC